VTKWLDPTNDGHAKDFSLIMAASLAGAELQPRRRFQRPVGLGNARYLHRPHGGHGPTQDGAKPAFQGHLF